MGFDDETTVIKSGVSLHQFHGSSSLVHQAAVYYIEGVPSMDRLLVASIPCSLVVLAVTFTMGLTVI